MVPLRLGELLSRSTAIVDGNRMIIAAGVTDSSGCIPKFAVPAPELSLSQAPGSKVRPYNIYDVSVSADGFFNARSVDVPVFSGTTSVQNFEMVPLPIPDEPVRRNCHLLQSESLFT